MAEGEWGFYRTRNYPLRLFVKESSILSEFWSGQPLLVDGSTKMGKGAIIHVDEIRALGSDGLKLYDDAGAIGSGLFLKDGGYFGVGVDPSYKFSIGSADGSDQIGIYHDNTDAYFRTGDGSFIFQIDEGTNTNTYLDIKGKGTGSGFLRVYDEANRGALYQSGVSTYLYGYDGILYLSSVSAVGIQHTANADITAFINATSGETKELKIYGYRAGDAKRSLEIGVGVDAADTASFDGVSNYYFDGNLGVGVVAPLSEIHVKGTDCFIRVEGSNDAGVQLYADAALKWQIMMDKTGVGENDYDLRFYNPNQSPTTPFIITGTSGYVGIGTATPSTELEVVGTITTDGFIANLVAKSANYTATASDYAIVCDAVGGSFTITLPAVASHVDRIYHVKKIDVSGNTITVDGNSAETIDDAATAVLTTQYESITIQSTGTEWFIL